MADNSSTSDAATERIDALLDDALDAADAEALRLELAGRPDYAAALAEAKRGREVRRAYWQELEPDAASGDAFADALILAARGAEVPASAIRPARRLAFGRVLRWGAAAAAGLLLAFGSGWAARDHTLARNGVNPAPATQVSPTPPKYNSTIQPVVAYEVRLTDPAGRVLAVQRFDSADKARHFAEDYDLWQHRRERLAGGVASVVVADRF